MAVAGLRVGTSPAFDVPASGKAYRLRYLAQQIKGGTGVLTAGRDRVVGLCAGRPTSMAGGGAGTEFTAKVLQWYFGLLFPPGRCTVEL